jgi:hypothetical protein
MNTTSSAFFINSGNGYLGGLHALSDGDSRPARGSPAAAASTRPWPSWPPLPRHAMSLRVHPHPPTRRLTTPS